MSRVLVCGMLCSAILTLLPDSTGRAEDFNPGAIGCPSGWVRRGLVTSWVCPDRNGPSNPVSAKPKQDIRNLTLDLQIRTEHLDRAVATEHKGEIVEKLRRVDEALARVRQALR